MEIGDEDIPYSCTASAEKKLCKMCRYYVINNKCCNVSWLRLLLTGGKNISGNDVACRRFKEPMKFFREKTR